MGSGAFSNVYELRDVDLCGESKGDDRLRAAANSEKARLAVKLLKKDTDEEAAADFEIEQKYLAALTIKYPHPNIIRLHGLSSSTDEPFLVLERVEETLVERMNQWRQRLEEAESDQVNNVLLERLDVAFQLSSALTHLHRLGIMYRDLKPDNIGFIGNTLKLLDFGLIKELNMSCVTGMYCMSGLAGSFKYMAPEVLLQRPYTLSADVYSFGMVLWQIMSLEPLLEDVTSKRVCFKRVVANNERPIIRQEWPNSVRELLETCWTKQANKRPSMKKILVMLQQEIEKTKENLHSEEE